MFKSKVFLFIAITAVVTFIIGYIRFSSTDYQYIYSTVKISQGYWWAKSELPPVWFLNGIKKGEQITDGSGKPSVQIIGFRYYPGEVSNRLNIYLTLKMKVGKDENGNYTYNRSQISVGVPLDLKLASGRISGIVTNIGKDLSIDQYSEKLVVLEKKEITISDFEKIKENDYYFDGTENVVKIIKKEYYGNDPIGTVRVTIEMKTKTILRQLVFGEEEIVIIGKKMTIPLSRSSLNEYEVVSIQDLQ